MKTINKGKYYKWEVLLLLWMGFLLNQGDRQVFNTVLPAIRDSLNLTDTSVGLIASLFNLAFALVVPIGGWLGDRFSRKWVVVSSVFVFSLATVFTGFAGSFLMLVLWRSVVTGGSEALYGPSNYSILAQYHTDTRARAMAIHQTSYYIGVILAGGIAGWIADRLNWHWSFIIFGALGILWGLLMVFRLENIAPEANPAKTEKAPGFLDGFKVVYTTPTALTMTIGFSGMIFVVTGFMTWMPAYLQEEFGQTQAEAGFNSMFWTYMASFFAILVAGTLSDRLALKKNKYRMYLQSSGLLLAAPFMYFMGADSSLMVLYGCFIGWGLFRAFFDANTYPVLYDVTPARLHSSCASVMGMTGFVAGAIAPVVLGAIKQSVGSLRSTFPVLAIIWVVCGLLMFVVAATCYKRDRDKVVNETM